MVRSCSAGQQASAAPQHDPRLDEPERVVKIDVLQDKARQLGVTSQEIATTLDTVVEGAPVTQIRDDIYLINVVGRANATERGSLETLSNVLVPASNGKAVHLSAVATLRYELEPPKIWRRDRTPTITVKAAVYRSDPAGHHRQTAWPRDPEVFGDPATRYSLAVGGTGRRKARKSQGPIAAVVPLMLFIMATVLMIQLQSFNRLFLVFAVAPLALIGVWPRWSSAMPRWGSWPSSNPRPGGYPDPKFGDPGRSDRRAESRRQRQPGKQ